MESPTSCVSTASSCGESFAYNSWNPLLELLFHEHISSILILFVHEIDLAKIALSCHFALDLLCFHIALDAGSLRTFSRFHNNSPLHLFTCQNLSMLSWYSYSEVWCYTRPTVAMMARSLGQRSRKGTHIPNRTCQTSRLHCVSCGHSATHHLYTSHFTLASIIRQLSTQ